MGGQRKGCSAILLREPGAGWHVCGYSPLNPAGCLGPSQLSQGTPSVSGPGGLLGHSASGSGLRTPRGPGWNLLRTMPWSETLPDSLPSQVSFHRYPACRTVWGPPHPAPPSPAPLPPSSANKDPALGRISASASERTQTSAGMVGKTGHGDCLAHPQEGEEDALWSRLWTQSPRYKVAA